MKNLISALFAFFICLPVARAQNAYLDSTFHFNGIQDSISNGTTHLDRRGGVLRMVLQPDGKIITLFTKQAGPGVYLTRLLPNGAKDVTFGVNGHFDFTHPVGTDIGVTYDVALQPNGKMVVLGIKGTLGRKDTSFLLGIRENGKVDSTFGLNGMVNMVPVGPANRDPRLGGFRLFARPNGKIIVVMEQLLSYSFETTPLLYQYKPNGVPDSSFGINGHKLASLPAGNKDLNTYGASLMADGRLVICGNTRDAQQKAIIAIARFDTLGAPDPGLDTDGWAFTEVRPYTDQVYARGLVVQSDDKIIVGVNVNINSRADTPLLVRFGANGALDVSYGVQGIARQHSAQAFSGRNPIQDLALLPNDSLLVAITLSNTGAPKENFSLMKLDPRGQLVTHWADNGFIARDFYSLDDKVNCMRIQPDGKILLGGSYSQVINSVFASIPVIVRFKNTAGFLPESVSTRSIFKPETLSIYPNPCMETATIQGTRRQALTVFNSLGQFVQTAVLNEANNFKTTVSGLPAGIYFIKSSFAGGNGTTGVLTVL